jgi:hypothetical protein
MCYVTKELNKDEKQKNNMRNYCQKQFFRILNLLTNYSQSFLVKAKICVMLQKNQTVIKNKKLEE